VAGLIALLLGAAVSGLVLFGSGLLGLILLESRELQRAIQENTRQQYALTQIRPLAGDLPLEFSQWAADPLLVYNAVRLVLETRPSLILECGSGSSTVILARCLQVLGRGRIVSLDHDPSFAQQTIELLQIRGLENLVTVVVAPLVTRKAGDEVLRWYGPEYEQHLDRPIDLLLVDGPPGKEAVLARYPAVPLLRHHLSPGSAILLDDGNRSDERTIAQLWARALDASLTYVEGGRGAWLLRLAGANDASSRLAG
jgi:predicted O-methyltransferase YrrM